MRAADCKNLSESPKGVFRQSVTPVEFSTGVIRMAYFFFFR